MAIFTSKESANSKTNLLFHKARKNNVSIVLGWVQIHRSTFKCWIKFINIFFGHFQKRKPFNDFKIDLDEQQQPEN